MKDSQIKKKRLFKLISLCFLIVYILTTCITEYKPEGVVSTQGILVVEAYIIAPIGMSIKISRSKDLQTEDPYGEYEYRRLECLDCRQRGAKNKPEWWPNGHLCKLKC